MINEYYVYLHRNPFTNKIFYVGKGKGNRAYSKHGRSKAWMLYVSNNNSNFNVEIVKEHLSNTEALILEEKLISEYTSLVNTTKTNKIKTDLINIADLFYYDETSPSFLRWKVEIRSGRDGNRVMTYPGQVAGGIPSREGYFVVRYNNSLYKCHRIIWTIFHGEIQDSLFVNHKDCNRQNNNILNLELVTQAENNRKAIGLVLGKCRKDNSSGVNGVMFITRPYKEILLEYWEANFKTDIKKLTKSFSVNKYGYDEAYRLACEWRKQMEELYYK